MKQSIREIIGEGYEEFWKSKKRYVVCKGGRASKKSTTAALKTIVKMIQYPLSNTLVIRKTKSTLKDSCFAQLKWAINRLGMNQFWHSTINPLQLTYLPTGQKILFRGCDDPLKITSITVEKGYLCYAWLEEGYECEEEEFRKIDESLRGKMPEGYYIQWLITFNPWSSTSWLKSRFFDNPDEDTLAMTTTYKCNEWLSEADRKLYENTKYTDPERYKVTALGEWGILAGQYFKEWSETKHVIKPFEIPKEWIKFRAMDFGQAKPYAVLWFAIDYDGNMYCYRELYGWSGKPNEGTGETAKQIGEKIAGMEKAEEKVSYGVLDSACWARTGVTGPTISEEINQEMVKNKLMPFNPSSKGRLEEANQLKQRLIGNKMKDGNYKPAIYFFSNCVNSIRTIPMIAHDKNKPELPDTDAEDHAYDAVVYACMSRPFVPLKKEEKGKRERYLQKEKRSEWTY